ncbi:MAG: porin, partial [Gemmatimonadota bacterium]
DPGDRDVELLDARFTIPVRPELRISAGQFKAPFSREALVSPGELQFARRAQGPAALAPLRQVGAELSGAFLDRRLRYRAGIFNGEGRTAGNPDGEMLYAAR